MKINSIELKNFRPYYGKHTINFATDDERHVTVIQGVNGAGKTSLFTALNWCLYGDDFVKRNIGHIGELVNRRAIANGGMVETSVEVALLIQGFSPIGKSNSVPNGKYKGICDWTEQHVLQRNFP